MCVTAAIRQKTTMPALWLALLSAKQVTRRYPIGGQAIPRFDTLSKVLDALGVKLAAVPKSTY